MEASVIEIFDQKFDLNLAYFSFPSFYQIPDMAQLKLLANFPNLKSVNLSFTNLNDQGLSYITANENIEDLNLQSTAISNKGLNYLTKLINLKNLRLKENEQLTNDCIQYINTFNQLEDLQIHETSIDQLGLQNLNLVNLKDLTTDIWDFDFLIALSKRLSNCTILVKGKGEFYKGNFEKHGL